MTFHDLLTGACPDCEGTEFLYGPRGGLSRNVECIGCKSRFNVVVRMRKVVMAQRIDGDGDWRSLGHSTIGKLVHAEG